LEKYSKIIQKNYDSDPDLSLLLVRKFGHILDKGLHREDVEIGHSKNIALELEKHIEIAERKYYNEGTLVWAKNKLKIYYDLQKNGIIPVLDEKQEKTSINFNDFDILLRNRRSDRSFLIQRVDDHIIKQLATTVNWAPSSCNKQPVIIYATSEPELAKSCLKCCKGGTGFSDFIPSFISFTADMRAYYLPEESYLPAIDTALGVQNFLLAAEILGLSATVLSWALKDKKEEEQLKELLLIPENVQIILNVVLGYPGRNSLLPIRKSIGHTLYLQNKIK
jgi:nitroreductase